MLSFFIGNLVSGFSSQLMSSILYVLLLYLRSNEKPKDFDIKNKMKKSKKKLPCHDYSAN